MPLMKRYFVYIMSNTYRTVLYIGITNDLERRVQEHKQYIGCAFTKEYNCIELAYYEETNDVRVALAREKQLKNWKREWKNELILKFNPRLIDLAEGW
jgi:putative endonuclease